MTISVPRISLRDLTPAQQRYLREARTRSGRYNGRCRRPVERLTALGLIRSAWEPVGHGIGTSTERWQTWITARGREVLAGGSVRVLPPAGAADREAATRPTSAPDSTPGPAAGGASFTVTVRVWTPHELDPEDRRELARSIPEHLHGDGILGPDNWNMPEARVAAVVVEAT